MTNVVIDTTIYTCLFFLSEKQEDIEKSIDAAVYALYGLTEEKIKIVEGE
jgi:hypothetical protein